MSKPILIVEDDADIRETLKVYLELKGFDATAARHGQDALETLRQGLCPAVILLDLMMPIMDGWEFRSRQLTEPELADIPVIVLSGAHFSDEEAANLQAYDILKKPVDIPRMLEHISKLAC